MIKRILFVGTFLTVSLLSAQSGFSGNATFTDSRSMDAFTKLTNRVSKSALTVKGVKGSPYFEERFAVAEVDYFGERLKDKTFLRYNAYSDELEMGNYAEQKETENILLKNNKIVTNFGGDKYKYLPYKTREGNFTKVGYVVVLVENENYSLYLKKTKVYMEATVARTSLERSFPARFIDNVEYFYNYRGNTLQYLKPSKRGLMDAFKENSELVKKYLKENKIRVKEQSEVEKLFNSINSSL